MTKVIVGVPTISYGREMIRDIMRDLDECEWKSIKVDTRNFILYVRMIMRNLKVYMVITHSDSLVLIRHI